MTLKDRLTEALAATPAEDTHRRDILNAALNAGDSDADIAAALDRLIEAREQKAVALEKTGQAIQAKAERDEAIALRLLADPSYVPAAGGTAKPGAKRASGGGIKLTRTQMIFGAVALVVLAAAVYFTLKPGDEADLGKPAAAQPITVFNDDHTMGNPKAPTTIVEYAAPICPHCAHFMAEEFPALKRDFIDTGKVFWIFRVYALQPADAAVEGIARCLPKDRYFPYIEMMFREQPQWDPDGYQVTNVEDAIIKLAATEGLSAEKAKSCMHNQANIDRLNQMNQDAQIRYQIDGTPTFVMDGQVVNLPAGKSPGEILRLRINSLGQ